MVEDLKKQKEDFIFRLRRFPGNIQNKLLFIHHYVKNILDYPDNGEYRLAEVKVLQEEIGIAFIKGTPAKEKTKIYGELTEGFCIPDDDLYVILSAMIEILIETKELIHLDMNTI